MIEIGGIQKSTLIDYPGRISAIVFLVGCNFRCPFCYSSELVLPEKIKNHPKTKIETFLNFLEERKDLLEGIVVCGGEPTIHKDLPDFLKKIKSFGYSLKLDTNGSNPEMLENLIKENLIDYVAMDVKAPKEKYDKAAGVKVDIKKIENSVDILKEGKIDFEFRTTVVPGILEKEDVFKIAQWISPAKKYYLQNFKDEKILNEKMEGVKPYSYDEMKEIKDKISPLFEKCEIR
jgi:pyruvate formate lyase activating enzyme